MTITIAGTGTGKINELTVPTASGSVVGSGANYPLNINASAPANSINIDTNGYLRNTEQVLFAGFGQLNSWANNQVNRWSAYINDGDCYDESNGRFTAPIAGTYLIRFGHIATNAGDVVRSSVRVNGSFYLPTSIANTNLTMGGTWGMHHRQDQVASGSEYAQNSDYSALVKLEADDYITITTAVTGPANATPYGWNSPANEYQHAYCTLVK